MKEIPFIFISASAQKKDLEKGKLSGAFAYLTKPFSADDLIRTIEMAIQSSKMSLENRS
jgi:CheY-like chemotaxis protein